jgi:hypothetical protein
VVLVHVQVARHAHRHVDQRMARKLFDHVIEKADAGGHVIGARAVEVDRDRDVGFRRLARDRSGTGLLHGLVLCCLGLRIRGGLNCAAYRRVRTRINLCAQQGHVETCPLDRAGGQGQLWRR